MKKVNVEFRPDPKRPDIGVTFTASEKDDDVDALMKRVSDPLDDTLTVFDSRNTATLLSEEDIISISSDNKKLKIIAENGEYELKKPLRDMEKQLHPVAFLKISRYEIINLGKVSKFDFSVTGTFRIVMKNGMVTWASRRLIPEIKKRLQGKE